MSAGAAVLGVGLWLLIDLAQATLSEARAPVETEAEADVDVDDNSESAEPGAATRRLLAVLDNYARRRRWTGVVLAQRIADGHTDSGTVRVERPKRVLWQTETTPPPSLEPWVHQLLLGDASLLEDVALRVAPAAVARRLDQPGTFVLELAAKHARPRRATMWVLVDEQHTEIEALAWHETVVWLQPAPG